MIREECTCIEFHLARLFISVIKFISVLALYMIKIPKPEPKPEYGDEYRNRSC
jgi:hypothetical protein